LKSTFLASAGIPPAEKPNTATSSIGNGAIAIAAITSCTNTANPKSMLAAGLVAQKAIALGLRIPAHVKCSFTPGSIAVDRYLAQTSLLAPLEQLGFNLAGYGCATCVGNSGDLAPEMQKAVNRSDNQLTLASVLSGNRNFESRIHPKIGANFLVSPALVVALAIAGTVLLDPTTDPIGIGHTGSPVYLKDLMPDPSHLDKLFSALNTTTEITASRTETFAPSPQWAALGGTKNATFPWRADDSYFKRPDVLNALLAFESSTVLIQPMKPLLVLGDNITTDHISPVGRISAASEAAHLLKQYGETSASFNSYGARRGNAGVMIRGTFDNPRLHNLLAGTMGPFTKTQSDAAPVSIFQASGDIARSGYAAVVIGGKNYGTGSARDWAAKGQRLLGVRAVIAESFERIHRSNLVMFGVAPVLLDAESLAQLRQLLIPESIVTVQLQKDHASYIRPSATIEVINADSHHAFKADLQLETAYEYTLLAAGGLLASMHLI